MNIKSNKKLKVAILATVNCTPKVRLLEVQFFHEQILR